MVLECGALCDPLTLEASFHTPIPSSFLAEQIPDAQPAAARLGSPLRSLDQLAFIDGVVAVVDAAAFWAQWQSVATVQDDAMGIDLDDADSRTHVAVMADQIEAAGVIVLNKAGAAGVEVTESVRSAIGVLNPAAAIYSFEAVTVDAVLAAPNSGSHGNGQPMATDNTGGNAEEAMVYERRVPFHPKRFYDWCRRYFFTRAYQMEKGGGGGGQHGDGDGDGDPGMSDAADLLGVKPTACGFTRFEVAPQLAASLPTVDVDGAAAAVSAITISPKTGDVDVMAARAKMKAGYEAAWHETQPNGQLLRSKGVCWIAGYHGLVLST